MLKVLRVFVLLLGLRAHEPVSTQNTNISKMGFGIFPALPGRRVLVHDKVLMGSVSFCSTILDPGRIPLPYLTYRLIFSFLGAA